MMPAIQRYNGPAYQVLNKFRRESPAAAEKLDVHILSAEFGLIPAGMPIREYDRRMTPARADELRPETLRQLEQIVSAKQYQALFVCMGKTYRQALAGYESLVPADLKISVADGGIGKKLAALRDWLHERCTVASREQWALDVVASCAECDWRGQYDKWEGSKTVKEVLDAAADHTNETDHETNVETYYNTRHRPGVSKSPSVPIAINYPVKDKDKDITISWHNEQEV